MTDMKFTRISAGVLLAAAICLPAAASAQTVSLDELRAKKGPEEKIEKLQERIKGLKAEIKVLSKQLIPYDTFFSTTLDDTAVDGDELYFGVGGNLPTNFVVQRDDDIEVGIKTHYRTGHDIPVSYVDTSGVLHTFVPAGPQVVDPEHGVSSAKADRTAWGLTFSLNTAYGDSPVTLADLQAKLKFDIDPTEGTDFLILDLVQINPTPAEGLSGYGWSDGITNVINDDGGTPEVTQNSFNYAFIADRIVDSYVGFPPATFDVQLIVKGHAAIKMKVHVVAPI